MKLYYEVCRNQSQSQIGLSMLKIEYIDYLQKLMKKIRSFMRQSYEKKSKNNLARHLQSEGHKLKTSITKEERRKFYNEVIGMI